VLSHFYAPGYADIGKAAWDSMREGMVCMSAAALGDIKAEIEELCSKVPCNEQQVQALEMAFWRIQTAQILAKAQLRQLP
jgi:hypothetical protein